MTSEIDYANDKNMLALSIMRYNQRIVFLLKKLDDFDLRDVKMWFNDTGTKVHLPYGVDQIPFDIIYFGCINYMVSLHENVFHLVKERERLIFPKNKNIYPIDIICALKNKHGINNSLIKLLEKLNGLYYKNNIKMINNYFKHDGMPYTHSNLDNNLISFYYPLKPKLRSIYMMDTLKMRTHSFYKSVIEQVNDILEIYHYPSLPTDYSGIMRD